MIGPVVEWKSAAWPPINQGGRGFWGRMLRGVVVIGVGFSQGAAECHVGWLLSASVSTWSFVVWVIRGVIVVAFVVCSLSCVLGACVV